MASVGTRRIGSSTKTNNKSNEQVRQARITKAKKAAKIGAAVAGTALAAYGAYKLHKFVRDKNESIHVGKNLAEANRTLRLLDENNIRNRPKVVTKDDISKANASAKIVNDIYNKTAKNLLGSAVGSGKRDAANDSFATAAKNVYKYYRNR